MAEANVQQPGEGEWHNLPQHAGEQDRPQAPEGGQHPAHASPQRGQPGCPDNRPRPGPPIEVRPEQVQEQVGQEEEAEEEEGDQQEQFSDASSQVHDEEFEEQQAEQEQQEEAPEQAGRYTGPYHMIMEAQRARSQEHRRQGRQMRPIRSPVRHRQPDRRPQTSPVRNPRGSPQRQGYRPTPHRPNVPLRPNIPPVQRLMLNTESPRSKSAERPTSTQVRSSYPRQATFKEIDDEVAFNMTTYEEPQDDQVGQIPHKTYEDRQQEYTETGVTPEMQIYLERLYQKDPSKYPKPGSFKLPKLPKVLSHQEFPPLPSRGHQDEGGYVRIDSLPFKLKAFSGGPEEEAQDFLQSFQLTASVSGWSDRKLPT